MRLINAVRELRHEHGTDIRTIALYTRAEQTAMFVREADEAVCIDDGRPTDAGSPYLDLDALEQALVAARADSAWVGWGFVAERPEFAALCERLGMAFVGPSADVMRRARRQDRRQAPRRAGRRARRPVERRAGRVDRGGPPARRRDRLPAHDQGDRRWRWSRHPAGRGRRRAGRGSRQRPGRGPEGLRRRDGLHGTGGDRRPPRRGAAHRRPPRHGLGGGRARLQLAAAQPEGDRGVALRRTDARRGRSAAGGGRPPGPGRRVRERRHGRVPVPARRSAASRSWRSTRGCRWSTRSPSSRPASTW